MHACADRRITLLFVYHAHGSADNDGGTIYAVSSANFMESLLRTQFVTVTAMGLQQMIVRKPGEAETRRQQLGEFKLITKWCAQPFLVLGVRICRLILPIPNGTNRGDHHPPRNGGKETKRRG